MAIRFLLNVINASQALYSSSTNVRSLGSLILSRWRKRFGSARFDCCCSGSFRRLVACITASRINFFRFSLCLIEKLIYPPLRFCIFLPLMPSYFQRSKNNSNRERTSERVSFTRPISFGCRLGTFLRPVSHSLRIFRMLLRQWTPSFPPWRCHTSYKSRKNFPGFLRTKSGTWPVRSVSSSAAVMRSACISSGDFSAGLSKATRDTFNAHPSNVPRQHRMVQISVGMCVLASSDYV